MLATLQIIGGNSIPHPLCPMLLLRFYSIGGIGNSTLCDRIDESALFLLRVVKTEGGLNIQVLYRVDIYVSITKHTPEGVTVVLVTL